MSKLATTALIAAAMLAGAAQGQTPAERTRAEVIAELKAAVESGEQQAMAMQMEGVGSVLPKRVERHGSKVAGTKNAAEPKDLAFKAGLIPRL